MTDVIPTMVTVPPLMVAPGCVHTCPSRMRRVPASANVCGYAGQLSDDAVP